MKKILLPLLLLGACQATPSLPLAIQKLQDSFAQAGAISPYGNINAWSPKQMQAFDTAIRGAQCKQHYENPIISYSGDKVDIQLSGSFTQSGEFAIAGGNPSISLSASVSKTNVNALSIPMSYIALSQLPERVEGYQYLVYSGLINTPSRTPYQEARIDEKLKEIYDNRVALEEHIKALIVSYPNISCSGKGNSLIMLGVKKHG